MLLLSSSSFLTHTFIIILLLPSSIPYHLIFSLSLSPLPQFHQFTTNQTLPYSLSSFKMNETTYKEQHGSSSCYFHPKEFILGVCHLCLNERLLILAAKQGANKSTKYDYDYFKSTNNTFNNKNYHNHNNNNKAKSYVSLPKIFAIASFFNPRDNFRHRCRRSRHRESHRQDVFDDVDATSTSLEEDDSFISIKFGDNGVASWDKTSSSVTKVSLEQHCSLSWGGQTTVKDATIKGTDCNNSNKSVVEHAKPRGPVSMRWRKRIGQLLQVIRWKKSSNATNVGGGNNVNKVVEGVKVVRNNKGWIRTLKSKTKE